jgi:hypothetical protein
MPARTSRGVFLAIYLAATRRPIRLGATRVGCESDVFEVNRDKLMPMSDAEKDLLNRLCDVVVGIMTKEQTRMFCDGSGNIASGWDLAQILLLRKRDANPSESK